MRQYSFKTIEPFFGHVTAGLKTFDIRLFDYRDRRHRALVQYRKGREWRCEFVNPLTKEQVVVNITAIGYLKDPKGNVVRPRWLVIYFDQVISFQPALKAAVCPPQALSDGKKSTFTEEFIDARLEIPA